MDSIENATSDASVAAEVIQAGSAGPLRIASVTWEMLKASGWDSLAAAGFERVLVHDLLVGSGEPGVAGTRQGDEAAVARLVAASSRAVGMIDVALDAVSANGDAATTRPDLFVVSDASEALDPRRVPTPHLARPDLHDAGAAERLGEYWGQLITGWVRSGLGGVRLRGLAGLPRGIAPTLLRSIRQHAPDAILLADTATVAWEDIASLSDAKLDGVSSSLGWWNWRDQWFEVELAMLGKVAPVVALLDSRIPGSQIQGKAGMGRALALCAGRGLGWIAPPVEEIREAAQLASELEALAPARRLSASNAPVQVMLRCDAADARWSRKAKMLLFNTLLDRPASIDPDHFLPMAGGSFGAFQQAGDAGTEILTPGKPVTIPPGSWLLFEADTLMEPAVTPLNRTLAVQAASWPRLAIENATPSVDGGLFPVKRIAGEKVDVEADIIGDGHDILSAALQWQAPGDAHWQETRMRLLGNDRWAANFPLLVRGLHRYRILAWRDHYATYRHELGAKSSAGVPVALELIEGQTLLQDAVARKAPGAPAIAQQLQQIEKLDETAKVEALLAPSLAALMDAADDRPHLALSVPLPVDAERTAAGFASWYEVFPRSMADDPHRHGTFADVERHLPRIRAMGFDVLYFPPVHPIGRVNRKGPNNTLTPGPEDVGSPYAVGNETGGHDALHPELGTLEDFLHLRRAAEAQGLEIALDFAIQCAPDHPWLKDHKDWFAWRPDGTVRYAENPPKKYQDIVNVDFYAGGAVPDLWLALANVVLFWAEQGIRLFRVDNPHTKPFPFWQWMIAEVRARYPDAVFLAEAFTRPKVMNRLAKVGFGQSYTYFTWRNSKVELTEYLTQLSQEAPKDFFRPHFFVNTPDINPLFLQNSGRPGFLIRAALAATLSGLWGVYNGFELCEGAPLPGREEYLDSEKFQIRTWDWARPGNIVPEITQLNRIRAENPALRSHLDIAFLPAGNDAVLFYEKATPDRSNCLLCMVSLDPHHVQQTSIELPLWKWGLPDQASIQLEDLIGGDRFQLTGKYHTVTLTPQQPYLIWRAVALS